MLVMLVGVNKKGGLNMSVYVINMNFDKLPYVVVFMGLMLAPLRVHSVLECPKCGNATIPYPLSTSKNCGHPNYPVTCNTQNQLELQALSGAYPILDLNATNQTMVVATSPFLGSSCITQDSLYYGNFSLNQSQPFFIAARNTVMLFNCTPLLKYTPLHCAPTSPCTQVLETRAKNCKGLFCCSFATAGASVFKYGFPVFGQESSYVSVIDLDIKQPARSWKYGLLLEWNPPPEQPCSSPSDCGAFSTCLKPLGSNHSACLCNDGHFWDPFSGTCPKAPFCQWKPNSFSCHKKAFAAGITGGLAAVIVLSAFAIRAYRRRKAVQREHEKLVKERSLILAVSSGAKSAKLFSGKEVMTATNGFARDRLLGSGGFGDVHKGILHDGTTVAIKSAKIGNVRGTEQVLNEVRILSQVNHRNLVRLLGCCVETPEPLLVYEFIPNGDLLEHLNGSKGTFLDWKTRLNIAYQSAEGLAYLHFAAYPPIYHRDVKSSNILLDQSLNAKVADFGISRLAEPDLTHVSTCAQGTLGYLDPEYYRNYQLTDKSDVYSFGVVLLELVTSQPAIDFNRGQDDANLSVYVQRMVKQGAIQEALDPRLFESAPKATVDSITAVVFLALDCLQETRNSRPSMKEVAEQLSYFINLEAAGVENDSEADNLYLLSDDGAVV